MKKTLLTLFIALVTFTVYAQVDTTENKIYLTPEKAPEFPGGTSGFATYLAKTVRYPLKSRTKGVDGKVLVTFVIEKDGSITNSRVLRPVAKGIDAEVLRVINLSPKWTPGIVNGAPVRTQFTYPVTFVRPQNFTVGF